MKSTFLLKLFASVLLFFIVVDSLNPNFEGLVTERFNDLRKMKEVNFKNCCKGRGILNHCSQLCTYDFTKYSSNPFELLTTLNPGWFLVHYFFPGKCYLSELDHFLPCSIEYQDVTECCKNITKIHELMETFPQMSEFKPFIPAQSDVSSDPEWCQNICAGKSFEITPKSVLSCSSTIKAALACYWHGNADTVVKGITGISSDKLKNVYDYVKDNGIPETLPEAEEMLKDLGPEVTKTLMEKSELLIDGLKQTGASQTDITKFKDLINQIKQNNEF